MILLDIIWFGTIVFLTVWGCKWKMKAEKQVEEAAIERDKAFQDGIKYANDAAWMQKEQAYRDGFKQGAGLAKQADSILSELGEKARELNQGGDR